MQIYTSNVGFATNLQCNFRKITVFWISVYVKTLSSVVSTSIIIFVRCSVLSLFPYEGRYFLETLWYVSGVHKQVDTSPWVAVCLVQQVSASSHDCGAQFAVIAPVKEYHSAQAAVNWCVPNCKALQLES